jgi:hypothetical protein
MKATVCDNCGAVQTKLNWHEHRIVTVRLLGLGDYDLCRRCINEFTVKRKRNTPS